MAATEPPARLRYLVSNALGEPVATILDSGHGWLNIEINRPPRTAFPTDNPDPNAPTFAGVLSALRGSAPGWAVVKQTPYQVCGQCTLTRRLEQL